MNTTYDKEALYISDLDGTLLLPDSSFPDNHKERLNRLIKMGLRFTIATARNYDSAYPILKGLNLNIPVILFNGVYLSDFNNGKILHNSQSINKAVVENILELALDQKIDSFIYTLGEEHKLYYQNATNPCSKAYIKSLANDGRLQQIDQFKLNDSEDISGFLLIDAPKRLEPVYNSLQQNYSEHLSLYFAEDVSMRGYYWLQSFHKDASKGNMVENLAQRLKTPLNKVIVFGDYLNDLDMFRVAGKALAMKNALPEVKKAAHEVIGSNEEGAVLQYLETIWLEK